MKACIFDLDGTLTDTLESITYSVQETLKEMGLMPITAIPTLSRSLTPLPKI